MEQKKTAGQAIASLVLGILSLIMFGLLTAIPAVICGHMAKSKIKQDPENLQGDGQALAGLIMGYITIGISVLMIPLMAAIAIPAFAKARDMSQEQVCLNYIRTIEQGKAQYAMEENLESGAQITGANLSPYLQCEFTDFQCPQDGVYIVHPAGDAVECSVHGINEM
jgi:hypothetical protein